MINDTIAAISTSLNESGIGIIRVSGEDSIKIVNQLYTDKNGKHCLDTYKSHTIHYGFIEYENEIIDEVMISIMKAPNSYTKEDIVEINCHGGIRICRNILNIVLNTGARLSEPGEFTKRAFLNGRLDLTRAEAVMDTIRATSDVALSNSVKQLRGNLYNKLNNICSDILYEIAFIESALDDPDSISLDGYNDRLNNKILSFIDDLNKLIKSYDEGRILSEGIKTVILGKPNAGKSSLLNALLDEDRAIVTDIPGTTRDVLTESVRLGDITLKLTDTAGIRNTIDPVESIGVDRAKQATEEADLIIYVADSSSNPDKDDEEIIKLLANKKTIILLNKNDISSKSSEESYLNLLNSNNINTSSIISTSMINGDGLETLKNTIHELYYSGSINYNDQIIITNLRHVHLLTEAVNSLKKVIVSIENDMPEDFFSIDLTDAYSYLATITGSEVSEDIVNEIFSKFCMGK